MDIALVRIDKKLHAPAKIAAIEAGQDLQTWLSNLIAQELKAARNRARYITKHPQEYNLERIS